MYTYFSARKYFSSIEKCLMIFVFSFIIFLDKILLPKCSSIGFYGNLSNMDEFCLAHFFMSFVCVYLHLHFFVYVSHKIFYRILYH